MLSNSLFSSLPIQHPFCDDRKSCYIPTTTTVAAMVSTTILRPYIYTHTTFFYYYYATVLLYFNFLSTFPDISCLPCNTCGFFYIFVLHLHKTGRHGYLLLPMPEINTQPKIILEGHFNSRYAKEWKFVLNNASKLNQSVSFVSLQLQ